MHRRIDGRARRALPRHSTGRSSVRSTATSSSDQLVVHFRRSAGLVLQPRRASTRSSRDAAPVTASLVFGGAILWMLIAIPIGILSALRPRSLLDRASMTFVLIGISAHPVWIGLIFAYFIGYKLGHHADHRLRGLHQPAAGAAGWARAVGLPHDPALDDVRDPLRRALRADDPRERDGHDERGLRAHRARQGRARSRS